MGCSLVLTILWLSAFPAMGKCTMNTFDAWAMWLLLGLELGGGGLPGGGFKLVLQLLLEDVYFLRLLAIGEEGEYGRDDRKCGEDRGGDCGGLV
jgi:mannose/fructose/N-acetylgalactosamine-specific phosphotransferase system component IIC